MVAIVCAILFLCFLLVIAKSLININEIDKRIDEILDEEKRQNKRIDIMEKREQLRQSEHRRDKAYIESKDLFKEW